MNTWKNLPGKLWVSFMALNPRLHRRALSAGRVLSPAERDLFLSMDRYDLAHSLAVASRLREDPLLYRAALLHDSGKLVTELKLRVRWAYTFLEVFRPRWLQRLTNWVEGEALGRGVLERMRSLPPGWKRGLFVQLHHGEIAAELLRRAGSDEVLVGLVEGHQKEPADERAASLRRVDDLF